MTDADLLNAWPFDAGPPLPRLLQFMDALAAGAGSATAKSSGTMESLGTFNRRLARLHLQLVGRPLEAKVACACGQELELALPMEAVAATADPPATVGIDTPNRRSFRLPCLSEIALAREPRALAEACALDEGDALSDEHLATLDAVWSAADPAAEITLDFACTACGVPIHAQADLALFVARELDMKMRGFLAEIHNLAGAYGWSEAEVLMVPAARRRLYAALIGGRS